MARTLVPHRKLVLALAGAALSATLALPGLAVAQAAQPAPPQLPTLSLSAAASSEVAQDKVTITLAQEIEGKDQAALSQQLNKLLESTLARAKSATSVSTRNGNYNVWANTDRDGKITGWRGRAELVLESRDFIAASKLAGELSQQMAVSNVAFSLSREAREAEEQRLLAEAAKAFTARAQYAAKSFGFSGFTVKQLDLSGSGTVPSPQPRAYAMSAARMEKADALPLEAGETTVTVSVRGTVNLITQP